MEFLSQILDPDVRWDFLDLGAGSANKSGAFLALLLVASFWFGLVIRRGWVVTVVLAVPLGLGLFATGSRGGLIAAVAGLIAVACFSGLRPVSTFRSLPVFGRWVLLSVAVCLIALFFAAGPGARFVKMVKGEDPSTTIRVEMYSAGLRMLSDAPGGWGSGRASEVFRHWYQESESPLHFLSLVNSHLTWMTERGIGFRVLYVGGWGLVLGLLWPGGSRWKKVAYAFRLRLRRSWTDGRRRSDEEPRGVALPKRPGEATRLRGTTEEEGASGSKGAGSRAVNQPCYVSRWNNFTDEGESQDRSAEGTGVKAGRFPGPTQVVGFGLWVCLGVGACFSSTLTWPGMWVLPCLFLFLWMGWVLGRSQFPWRSGFIGVGAALVGLIGIHGISLALPREVPIFGGSAGLVVGEGEPTILLVGPEEGVLGDFYGQALREAIRAAQPGGGSVRVLFGKEFSEEFTKGVETVVFCGGLPTTFPETDASIQWMLLNPSMDVPANWESLAVDREVLVLLGSASDWQQRFFWESVCAESDSMQLREVPGAGRFLPGWEKVLFGEMKEDGERMEKMEKMANVEHRTSNVQR